MSIFTQAQRLTLFKQKGNTSLGYHLFQHSLKKINILSKLKPQLISENICSDIVADCLKYYKHTFQEEYYLRQLDNFIANY